MLPPPSLDRECRVFAAYLLGSAPAPYVIRKYHEAHQLSPAFSDDGRFDRHLVRVAAVHGALTRAADAYARLVAPNALLRKKLVLLLAILETSAPSSDRIDAAIGGGRSALVLRLFISGIASILSAAAGALLFLPTHIAMSGRQRRTG